MSLSQWFNNQSTSLLTPLWYTNNTVLTREQNDISQATVQSQLKEAPGLDQTGISGYPHMEMETHVQIADLCFVSAQIALLHHTAGILPMRYA
ncbi:Guanine-specific ribonuclease N1/T1 [Penicillium sp. IBT 31633x]|nr:Guanine-specific ribonuclease N1/T1 [Penicillium sp. IBT 31633x]